MNYDQARTYLLGRPESWEDYPFGPGIAVFKISGKMFATLGSDAGVARMNLKCDPDEAVMLRDIFDGVKPGYHMNKRHWNTVLLDNSVPRGEVERLIDNSYALVVQGLPSKERKALQRRTGQVIK
ncbi:MAG: MmcQ/YjbR family DNA-binding protein [Congregibacter sp.]|nr:MmcQ/YjbR family DNA-binding protein [Congregibacter sp.]MDP5071702.1 MmcQ/YjbR family DNA-binding protein [Congregibacter sp.]